MEQSNQFENIEVQVAKEIWPHPIRKRKFSIETRSISVALDALSL